MKKLTSNINFSTTPAGVYNQMKRVPGTSFYEAKRTLEAIKTVSKQPRLMQEVVKESKKL